MNLKEELELKIDLYNSLMLETKDALKERDTILLILAERLANIINIK